MFDMLSRLHMKNTICIVSVCQNEIKYAMLHIDVMFGVN